MEGRFLLRRDSRPNEFGEYKVVLQFCTQGTAVKKSTGISVHPDYWLGDNGDGKYILSGKNGHPKSYILNQRLVNLKKEIEDKLDMLLVGQNKTISVSGLRSVMNGDYDENLERENGKVGFVDFALEQNKELYTLGKIGYSVWENILSYMKKFKEYLQEEKRLDTREDTTLYCRDLTPQLVKDYIKWRQRKKNSNDTINKSLTPIFKTVKVMCRRGWIGRDACDEICGLYLPGNAKTLDKDTTQHYLTEDQIRELMTVVKDCKYERTRDMFDMFMFSIYTCGLRFSDIGTLRWEEIDMEKRLIRHMQVKGHTRKAKTLTIPISDEGMKILEKWRGRYDNYVFGLLGDEFDLGNDVKLKETLNAKNKTINTSLKVLGDRIKLSYPLHFHVSRHTFATLALNKKVDVKTISTLMGHSSVMTTEKVYATLMPSTLEQTVEERLNFHF